MFGREPKTKLPSMRIYELLKTSATGVAVRERDSDKKFAMKSYAGERHCNNSKEISVGDTVLVRNDDKGNNLSPTYKPKPETIYKKRSDFNGYRKNVTRNSSRMKKSK
ncbi:hypothetical protein KP79_PYT25486 [Mizuhopecten yessoensis]|uniref:Uncharacterized protein n=1 Tax=Mizuhopecten yessoensis TaxID=6573 RepID=A0A210QX17_MIZYE|nr:hypothetical protein KP79_PYT25486 [Mizuhopecten yessoensis]